MATQDMWRALTRAIGRPGLGGDPSLASQRDRVARAEELDALVEAWTEKQGKHEVMETLGAAGAPCGAVLDSGEILSNEHLIGRGMGAEVEHPTRGRSPMPGNPVRLSASATEVTRASLLGEHSAEVYGELLGLSAADVAALRADEIV